MIMEQIQRLFSKIKKPCFTWVVFSGVATAVAIMYSRLGFLAWISLIPYFMVLYQDTNPERGKRHLFRTGFLFGCSFYLPLFSLFYALYPMETMGLRPAEAIMVILVAHLGTSALYSLPHGLLACVLRRLRRRNAFRERALIIPLSIASLWVLMEWVGSQTWMGIPWGRLAVSQYRLTPLIQSASLLGSYFLSFLIVCVNALLAYGFYQRFLLKNHAAGQNICILCAVVLFSGNLLYGIIALNTQPEPDETVSVAIVQGNISSSEKWGENGELISLIHYLELTTELSEEEAVDLIVWTEGCIPVALNQYPPVSGRIQELAAECGAVILVGAYYRDESDLYNAVYACYPDGTVSSEPYFKRKLMPFGEYMPWSSFLEAIAPALAKLNLMRSSFTAGTDSAVFSTDFGSIGGLVCFDSVYETPSLSSVRDGAELLALLSNDAWYDSSPAVYELLGHSVLRAVENGRFLVRSANTGFSAIIDANGRILTESDLRTTEVIRGEVSFYSHRTLYSRVGNILVPICLLYILALFLPLRRKTLREKNS